MFKFINKLMLFIILVMSIIPIPKISASENNVLGSTDSMEMNLLLTKPAVVQVTNIISGQVIIQSAIAYQLGAPSLSGKSYNFSFGMSGTGFFITPDGYLITNGHVAKPDDSLIAYYAVAQKSVAIYKDALKAVTEAEYNYTPTDAELNSAIQKKYGSDYTVLYDSMYEDYKSGNLKVDNVKLNNYIQTGIVAGSAKIVQENGKGATVVSSLYEGSFDSKDLALLKVEGSNFPIVTLGTFDNVNVGSKVYAIGYPGIVESGTGVFTDEASGLEPSVTSGIISAQKKLVDGSTAFQTDAAITHGNSGGPAINESGQVIGVVTWGFGDTPGGQGFNFLISVEQIKNILQRNNVQVSESITNKKWAEALNLFNTKCYTDAKKKFEEAKSLYPGNVDVDDYIQKSQAAIEKGEDSCSSDVFAGIGLMAVVGFCCLILIIVAIVFIVIMSKKKKEKKNNIPTAASKQPDNKPAEKLGTKS